MEERLIASDLARYKVVKKGWFAYNPMRLNIGSIAQWKGDHDVLVSPDYVVFKCLSDGQSKIDPDYLNHLRQSDLWKRFVTEVGDGSVRVRIYYKDLARLQFKLHELNEQRAIANCLSSLDDLIASQTDKVTSLNAHKRGLLQRLLPCEEDAAPQLRFSEFRNTAGWTEIAIGAFCQTYSGGTPSSTNEDFYGGDIPFIRSAEIGKNYTELTLTKEGLQSSSAKMIEKGDVLYALYGANSGEVALAKLSGAINQAILCIRSPESNRFIFQFLFFNKARIIDKFIQGGQGNLSGEIVKSIKIPLPSPEEQRKIGDCLASLDELIVAEEERLDALIAHKKGLMQGFFRRIEGTSE